MLAQNVPIRMWQTEGRIVIAAPLPGVEPDDILVELSGDRVILQGEERGPRQHGLDLVIAEWMIGPYYREIQLSCPVAAELANATYGNGVLVLNLPKLGAGAQPSQTRFRLQVHQAPSMPRITPVRDPCRGERIGHTGRDARPATPDELKRRRQEQLHGPKR
jgi:HSP20 family protein